VDERSIVFGDSAVQTCTVRAELDHWNTGILEQRTFHDKDALLPGRVDDLLCFSRIDGQGLFAEYMFPGRNRIETVCPVQRVRSTDIDDVHTPVVIHALIVGIHDWSGRRRPGCLGVRWGSSSTLPPHLFHESVALFSEDDPRAVIVCFAEGDDLGASRSLTNMVEIHPVPNR
jgi:hypothetical protein